MLAGSVERPHPLSGYNAVSKDAAKGMHAGAERPHSYSPEVAFTCTDIIDEFAGEEHSHRINQREATGNKTVVIRTPVKFRSDKVDPRQ